MSWQTLVIANRAKLDVHLNHLVVRQSESVKRVYLQDLDILIIETTQVALTTALLNELVKAKIQVIFCDEARYPSSQLIGYYGSYDTSAKIKQQIAWQADIKNQVWQKIVEQKILNQAKALQINGIEASAQLKNYASQVALGDTSNREGHAAKVYFNALFGMEFSRHKDLAINSALNYGYAVFLSAITREICVNGYITQLGIFHDNVHNHLNLASDLIEIFRPLIDVQVKKMHVAEQLKKFQAQEKHQLLEVLNRQITIDNRQEFIINAMRIFVKSVFDALNAQDTSKLKFFDYEF